jgi:hypothetical protein
MKLKVDSHAVVYLLATIAVEALLIWDATERTGAGLVVAIALIVLFPVRMAGAYRREARKRVDRE